MEEIFQTYKINSQRLYPCTIFVCYDSHVFFFKTSSFAFRKWCGNVFYLPKHMYLYMIAGKRKHESQRSPEGVSGTGTSLGYSHSPHLMATHNLLSPLCSLSFSSSSQGFHNIFIYLVSCGNFAWQGVCYHAFRHSNPLCFWVLSWQRVVHSVNQLILICLHLVLCGDAQAALQSYLIFKLSV